MPGVIALDVGGSSVKSAAVGLDGQMLTEVCATPIDSAGSAQQILATLVGAIEQHQRQLGGEVLGVALAFPGPFDYLRGVSRIRGVAKYESLYGMNLAEALRERLGAAYPIRFWNDAEAAIVGECCHGAGQDYARIIGVTLGTGFGSAFVIGGVPQEAGPGVPARGWLYPERYEGQRADDLFSARGLQVRLREGGVTVTDVAEAAKLARQGDDEARRCFEAFGHDMGAFLAPFAETFRADAVLVLGGIAGSFTLFAKALSRTLPVAARPGTLGSKAALIGVAERFSASC